MSALGDVEKLVDRLTHAEKLQLLRRVARDLDEPGRGVESRPGVCGGVPCIAGTRIPVWLLEQTRRLGATEADLLRAYPSLRAEDLVNAWAYVRAHPDEIERQILDDESA